MYCFITFLLAYSREGNGYRSVDLRIDITRFVVATTFVFLTARFHSMLFIFHFAFFFHTYILLFRIRVLIIQKRKLARLVEIKFLLETNLQSSKQNSNYYKSWRRKF